MIFAGRGHASPISNLPSRSWRRRSRGWIEGDVGPTAGLGAFYHLTNEWSLRGDAQATLGLDGDCQMVYSLGFGVQYSF